MHQLFLTFIKEHQLAGAGDHLLLGISGGLDSMVLLDLFSRTDFHFGVAHVNYKLRSADSDADADLVRVICADKQIKLHTMEVDPKRYESNASIQMVARTIRYEFFNKLLEKEGYTRIVTAHHANDNLETILFNLTKGTGISGLKGMAPRREQLIRPLLDFSREEIVMYAKKNGIRWREDSSNAKNDYHRNRIRNLVIPQLKRINPSLEATLQDTLMRIGGAAALMEREKSAILRDYADTSETGIEINTNWLENNSIGLAILYEILKGYGFNFSDTKDIFWAAIGRRSGSIFPGLEYELLVDRGKMLISKYLPEMRAVNINQDEPHMVTPFFSLKFENRSGNEWQKCASDACFDAGLLHYPLALRHWRHGDSFVPLGMTGRKKVSDFLIDKKIPLTVKRKLMVLESGKEIVWVVGQRIDNRYKVTGKTTRMLCVSLSRTN